MKEKSLKTETLKLKDRTNHLLEEIRIILPGTQALLGFQLVGIFSPGFVNLALELKQLHLISLCLVTLTTVLLIAPAAYDRIAEKDKDTEFFLKFSTRLIIAALISLALAIAGELYVVVYSVIKSQFLALSISGASLATSLALWFGYSFYKRP